MAPDHPSNSEFTTRSDVSLRVRTALRAGGNVPFGDAVAWFTHATGLDKLADKYTELSGKDCGCDERRRALNDLIRF